MFRYRFNIPGTVFQKFLISGYPKAKRIVKKLSKKDMFINPSERSLSWPTGLVEAKVFLSWDFYTS